MTPSPHSLPTSTNSSTKHKLTNPHTSSSFSSSDETLYEINCYASRLPPHSSSHGDLNPLIDFVQLFKSIPLTSRDNADSQWFQANRQQVHTSLHSIKSVFETLIRNGRLHGKLVGKSGDKKAKTTSGSAVDLSASDNTTPSPSAALLAVKEWIQERWQDYLVHVSNIIGQHWDIKVRISALNALMSLLRTEATFLTSLHRFRQAQFPSTTFQHVVNAILEPLSDDGVLRSEIKEEFLKWWNRCDDIRFYFLTGTTARLSTFASTSSLGMPRRTHYVSNLIGLFESLTTMPTKQSELNEWWCSTPVIIKTQHSNAKRRKTNSSSSSSSARADGSTGVFDSSSESEGEAMEDSRQALSSNEAKRLLPPLLSLSAHRKVFQECWLALLALPQNETEAKRVLGILHRQVLPHMTEPRRLMDWLVDCTSQGGTIAILALNGLFTLMQRHNLEYPNFYTTLYSLLTRSLLHTRYRPRFFRLLIVFLSSTHISASLVASFIKRLARLSLSAPPAAIVTIIPIIYNLLKLHPGCMVLIHRPSASFDESEELGLDPFDPEELDPNNTHALDSSLWEISSLRNHFLQSVNGLAKIFNEVMNKHSFEMEDFLDHSYATMFETEINRVIRNAPALAEVPKRQPIGDSFFPRLKSIIGVEVEHGNEVVDEEPVDVVSRLWSF